MVNPARYRGRQRRANAGNSKQQYVTKSQMKRENHLIENGQRFNPSPHPPDFMVIPWFNCTVRIEDFGSITLGIDGATAARSVIEQLRDQLLLSVNDVLEVRIQSVRIWGPIVPMSSTTALPHLRARFWSLVPQVAAATGSSAFAVLEDISAYPDQVSRASIGYTYPKSQQAIPFQQNNSGTLVSMAAGGGAGNLAYIRLLWRPRQTLGSL
jgi:hypothetical protein